MTKDDCAGCRNNFYNGNNNLGVQECWSFKGATMKLRKKVGTNDVPPWTWKPKMYPSCYQNEHGIMVEGDRQQ